MSAHAKMESLENRTLLSADPTPTVMTGDTPVLWSTNINGGALTKLATLYSASQMISFGNSLYFIEGTVLYKTDGTPAGTIPIAGTRDNSVRAEGLVVADGHLYYSVSSYDQQEHEDYGYVYVMDSAGNTTKVSSLYGNVGVSARGGKAYLTFTKYAPYSYKMYLMNGATPQEVDPDTVPPRDPGPSMVDSLTVGNSHLYAFDDGTNGSELWRNTGAGEELAQDIITGPAGSSPRDLKYVNGRVVFVATGPTFTKGSAAISDGALYIEGTDFADNIFIYSQNGGTTVTLKYNNGSSVVYEGANFDDDDFNQIVIHAGQSNDDVFATRIAKSLTVYGESGDDKIFLDTDVTANATLDGGDGNDTLTGGGGNDVLIGGNGNDTADYSTETTSLLIAAHSGYPGPLVSSDRGSDSLALETLLSGSGDDSLDFQTDQADSLQYVDGGAGNDRISMLRTVSGATINGGEGNDTLVGFDYQQAFALNGGPGDDLIIASPRSATNFAIDGGAGNDVVDVSDRSSTHPLSEYLGKYANVEGYIGGHDGIVTPTPPPPNTASGPTPGAALNNHVLAVQGTTGSDRITIRHKSGDASLLQVVINGKISNFTFSDVNKIEIAGGNGNDWIDLRDIAIGATILGGNGNDSIYGSDGGDSIDGGRGDDYLAGMGGNDSITGGIGADFIRGGEGTDRLVARIGLDDTAKNKGDHIINDLLG